MTKKKCILGAIACMGAFSLVSCDKQRPEAPEQKYVGVACYNQSDAFVGELLNCFKEECEERNLALTIRDAVGSQRKQNDQVKELLEEGCNVLCVNLVDRTDPSEIIDMAREKDVQVIFFNREPVRGDLTQWDNLYYVGADAEQSGVMQGELATQYVKENKMVDRNQDGRIQYVILEGEMDHQDAIIRTESVINTLEKNGIILERLKFEIANWSRVQAQNRMTQTIEQYPTEIEVVLSNNDAMALGAIDAYKAKKYSREEMPVFFGIDGILPGLTAVKSSELAGTVYNDKERQAEVMADLACAIVKGEQPEEIGIESNQYIYIPYEKVTKENVADFLMNKNEGR